MTLVMVYNHFQDLGDLLDTKVNEISKNLKEGNVYEDQVRARHNPQEQMFEKSDEKAQKYLGKIKKLRANFK